MGVNKNYPDSINYTINLFRVNTMVVTKDLLRSSNVPHIGSILISSENFKTNQILLHNNKFRASCFYNFFHLYNSNSNHVVKSYLASAPNKCLE